MPGRAVIGFCSRGLRSPPNVFRTRTRRRTTERGLCSTKRSRARSQRARRGCSCAPPSLATTTTTAATARPTSSRREAVRLAEELGDPEVLSFALFAEHDTMWRPGTADTRLAVAERMERAAESSGQAEIRAEAALLAAAARFELLDSRAASALVRAVYLLGELSQPYCRYLSLTRRVALLTAGRVRRGGPAPRARGAARRGEPRARRLERRDARAVGPPNTPGATQ